MTSERSAALDYHEATKHSFDSIRRTPHFLDWDHQPLPFKLYRNVDAIELPPVGETRDHRAEKFTRAELARLLYHTAGVTKRRRFPGGGEMLFRAAACTGALYHVEVYVVAGPLPDLDAGVYHYGPKDHVLTRLRASDWRKALYGATGEAPPFAQAPVALILTSTFWRNAWKYRTRAYRHVFWDSGTMLSHVEAMAAMLGVRAYFTLGFADADVNALIGADGEKEAAVVLVALGSSRQHEPPLPELPGPMKALDLETVPLSRVEVDYPSIRETHRATSLASGDDAARWRAPESTSSSAIEPIADIESVIRRRGSSRRFARASIPESSMRTVLSRTGPPAALDVPPMCDIYVIVNDVEGVAAGAYHYDRSSGELTCLREGDFRREARYLDLEQDLAGDASVNVYTLVSLDAVIARFGERGYRAAQLEGGLLGGRMYLASYALGLGATGLTFFDDAVVDFFSPHAAGKSVMFLLAFGVPAKRTVLAQR